VITPATTSPTRSPASVSEFLDQFPRVDTYAEIDEILRSPDFIQGSHFESKPVFGGSLVVIDGPEHRQRRKMLMGMFSHAALRRNEKEILAPAIRHAFDALAAARGAVAVPDIAAASRNRVLADAESALIALGYKPQEAARAISAARALSPAW
jgi:cytochrome P450